MKRIIICEGKTDAILVSIFLHHVYGWAYTRDPRQLPKLTIDKKNEVLNWYHRSDRAGNELAVWGVGGITSVGEKLLAVSERTQSEQSALDRFSHIVVLIDRDNRTTEECNALILSWCRAADLGIADSLTPGEWTPGIIKLKKTPVEDHRVMLLPIVLPPTQPGCLEVFLAEALRSANAIDKQIVDGCRQLVGTIPDQPYLPQRRLRPKAEIGACLSIMSPDWVFGDLDEKLGTVAWEKIEQIHAAYARLAEL